MKTTQGDRRATPADPTAERTSDPVPVGDDLLARENPRRGDTPRRYEEELERGSPVTPDDRGTRATHD